HILFVTTINHDPPVASKPRSTLESEVHHGSPDRKFRGLDVTAERPHEHPRIQLVGAVVAGHPLPRPVAQPVDDRSHPLPPAGDAVRHPAPFHPPDNDTVLLPRFDPLT